MVLLYLNAINFPFSDVMNTASWRKIHTVLPTPCPNIWQPIVPRTPRFALPWCVCAVVRSRSSTVALQLSDVQAVAFRHEMLPILDPEIWHNIYIFYTKNDIHTSFFLIISDSCGAVFECNWHCNECTCNMSWCDSRSNSDCAAWVCANSVRNVDISACKHTQSIFWCVFR